MKEDMKEYDVVKFYQTGKQTTIRHSVSLDEARRICSDPETSSMTASKPTGCDGDEAMIERWHDKQKHWFYGFREA